VLHGAALAEAARLHTVHTQTAVRAASAPPIDALVSHEAPRSSRAN
jgi:hypothetical protein